MLLPHFVLIHVNAGTSRSPEEKSSFYPFNECTWKEKGVDVLSFGEILRLQGSLIRFLLPIILYHIWYWLYFRESICHTLVILLFVGCRGASIIPGSVRTAWSGSGLAAAFAVGLVKGPDNSRNTNATKKTNTKTNTNLLLVRGTSWRWNHVLTSYYIPVFNVGRSLACCIREAFPYLFLREPFVCEKQRHCWNLIFPGRLRK